MFQINFKKSKEIKVELRDDQWEELCSKETIKEACQKNGVFAFDIYDGETLIGFAMFVRWKGTHFLWNYAIDKQHQNKGYGTAALYALFQYMKKRHKSKKITTTYIWGNDIAKHVYEKVGFVETDVVVDDDYKEVNMKILLD